jgi:hypothetical protein
MFIGRCATDGRFENKIGLDIMHTVYRKPIWNWHEEIESAEKNIRLKDPTGGTSGTYGGGEYFPMNGTSSYYLPPDVLFAPEWVERAGVVPAEKGSYSSGGQFMKGDSFHNRQAQMRQQGDYYTGDAAGFIFCAATPVIEEMFNKSLFGLPIQMQESIINPNAPLFLFDTISLIMFGIFNADSQLR